jgi:hypothetical protein
MSHKTIKFIASRKVLEEYWPKPISYKMPDWWKEMPAYGGFENAPRDKKVMNNSGDYNSTIKRCVPILDSLTLGYVIYTDQDMYVQINEKKNHEDPNEPTDLRFSWRPGISNETKVIEGHKFGQAAGHPLAKLHPGRDVFKWINPWHIQTPPGYSTLFLPPMNNPNGFFEALPGVVDTDTYTNVVNFPFVIHETSIETIIPAGTPVVQVFPFKRESWQMETEPTEEDLEHLDRADRTLMAHIASAYRRFFWSKKEFK